MFYTHIPFYLYALTLTPFALCTGFYGLRSPWRQSAVGRSLFTLLASLTAVLIFALVSQITVIPETVRDVLRVLTLGTVAAAGWVLLVNILRLQRESRDCPSPSSIP